MNADGWIQEGFVSREDLAATYRAHQAAVDTTTSLQRDATATEDWLKEEKISSSRR